MGDRCRSRLRFGSSGSRYVQMFGGIQCTVDQEIGGERGVVVRETALVRLRKS